MKFGIEVILQNKKLIAQLKKKRVSLVCHPASVDNELNHSFDLIHKKIGLKSAFGPQHGVKGDKQDNMIETEDYIHPQYQIPIFSLYGKVRRPTQHMMDSFDVVIFDLQDVGCRIYTFEATLLYMMQACAQYNKTLIIADRPNPVGRDVEGLTLIPGFESFVGESPIPMRHGLTLAELALFYKDHFKLEFDLQIIKMQGYSPNKKPGFGWPMDRAWVNPSPNIPTLNSARFFPGSVMIEGTTLSEGRGTTRALEIVGASDIDIDQVIKKMQNLAPQWLKGALIRTCYFEPTFHKHEKKLCQGFQIHTDFPGYQPRLFKPYRITVLFLKSIRSLYPDYQIFRDFAYEYVENKLAFDVITGSEFLRKWIDDKNATISDLESKLKSDESAWHKQSRKYHLYK